MKNRLWMSVFIFSAINLTACNETEIEEKPIRPVQVWEVSQSESRSTFAYSGQIYARHESPLSFRVGGKVISRHVELGDTVKAGETLARIDITDLQLGINSAEANVQATQSELITAADELKRTRKLFNKEFISQAALDAAQNRFNSAQAQVDAAKAQLNIAKNQSNYGTLKAPKDGVITQVNIESGQVVAAGQTAFQIAQTGEYEVHIEVGESVVQTLTPEQKVKILLWADTDKTLDGQIRDIAPAASQSRTWLIKIAVLNDHPDLKLGMTAKALFQSNQTTKLSWLPATALFQDNKQPAVWIITENNTVALHPVTPERYLQDGILVSGLENGLKIVAAGAYHLHSGQQIQVIPYTGKAHHTLQKNIFSEDKK